VIISSIKMTRANQGKKESYCPECKTWKPYFRGQLCKECKEVEAVKVKARREKLKKYNERRLKKLIKRD
jgi:hypothetical protein